MLGQEPIFLAQAVAGNERRAEMCASQVGRAYCGCLPDSQRWVIDFWSMADVVEKLQSDRPPFYFAENQLQGWRDKWIALFEFVEPWLIKTLNPYFNVHYASESANLQPPSETLIRYENAINVRQRAASEVLDRLLDGV